MASGGFIPAISFYVDGVFRLPAPLDNNGVGETDIALPPGTYAVTAHFGPIQRLRRERQRTGQT